MAYAHVTAYVYQGWEDKPIQVTLERTIESDPKQRPDNAAVELQTMLAEAERQVGAIGSMREQARRREAEEVI